MTTSTVFTQVHTEIERVLASLDGELTSHSRVIDALLDLRNATDNPHLTSLVDDAMRNLPGKNAAETTWFRNQLVYLGSMFELSVMLDANPAAA